MFHASLCHAIGIERLEEEIRETLKGVVGGEGAPESPVYFHKISIQIGADQFETMAGFSWSLAVGALLGRRGFFENFLIRFDCSLFPPQLDVRRLHRT